MEWNDWLRILRWRALEEGDADGTLVNAERRRAATAHSRAGLKSEDVVGDVLDDRTASFLQKRATWLENEAVGWRGDLIKALAALRVPQGRRAWAIAGWAAAFIAGYAMTDLGQEREFNLLALPLVGLVAWNIVVVVLGLLCELLPARTMAGRGGWLAEVLAHGVGRLKKSSAADENTVLHAVRTRFEDLAWPLAWRRLHAQLRSWLHVGAALMALGSAAALYARGWSREYRAVWESTLLGDTGAAYFFGTLFRPASAVMGREVPLSEVPGMRRTLGKAEKPADALPWIHLYAGTLLVLVIAPRLLLAGLGAARLNGAIDARARSLGWGNHLRRLLHAVEGGEQLVEVLVHGMETGSAHKETWDRGVRQRFGGMTRAEYVRIAPGDEDDFAAQWQPRSPLVVLLFNMATTPEAEVQRRLAADLRQRLLTRHAEPDFVVLLDGTSLCGRWAEDKIAGRERLWTEMMEGLADEVLVALRKDGGTRELPASTVSKVTQ